MNDLFQKFLLGAVGSTIAVSTHATYQVLSLIASGCTIVFMVLSIMKLIKELRSKKGDDG